MKETPLLCRSFACTRIGQLSVRYKVAAFTRVPLRADAGPTTTGFPCAVDDAVIGGRRGNQRFPRAWLTPTVLPTATLSAGRARGA